MYIHRLCTSCVCVSYATQSSKIQVTGAQGFSCHFCGVRGDDNIGANTHSEGPLPVELARTPNTQTPYWATGYQGSCVLQLVGLVAYTF